MTVLSFRRRATCSDDAGSPEQLELLGRIAQLRADLLGVFAEHRRAHDFTGESDSRSGEPTVLNGPRPGWSTVTIAPRSVSVSSSISSLVESTGPHGTLSALSASSASHLVCLSDQSSINAKTLSSFGSRSCGRAQSGWSARSGLPISSANGAQP